MSQKMSTVLVIRASGSIGRYTVTESLRAGYETRALVRAPEQASLFNEATKVIVGDPADAGTLGDAFDGVAEIVLGSPQKTEKIVR